MTKPLYYRTLDANEAVATACELSGTIEAVAPELERPQGTEQS